MLVTRLEPMPSESFPYFLDCLSLVNAFDAESGLAFLKTAAAHAPAGLSAPQKSWSGTPEAFQGEPGQSHIYAVIEAEPCSFPAVQGVARYTRVIHHRTGRTSPCQHLARFVTK